MNRSTIQLARPIAWYRAWRTTGAKAGTESIAAHLFRVNPPLFDPRTGALLRPESLGPACGAPGLDVKGAGYLTPRAADRLPCGLCARILAAQPIQRKASA